MATPNRIFITKTKGEWDAVRERISEMKGGANGGLKAYVNREVSRLCEQFKECQCCVTPAEGGKVEEQFYSIPEHMETLREISRVMKRPVASIVDDFIIAPLLLPRP